MCPLPTNRAWGVCGTDFYRTGRIQRGPASIQRSIGARRTPGHSFRRWGLEVPAQPLQTLLLLLLLRESACNLTPPIYMMDSAERITDHKPGAELALAAHSSPPHAVDRAPPRYYHNLAVMMRVCASTAHVECSSPRNRPSPPSPPCACKRTRVNQSPSAAA